MPSKHLTYFLSTHLNLLKSSCKDGAYHLQILILQYFLSINKDILLHNHNTTTKIWTLVLTYYYHPIKNNSDLKILGKAMKDSWPYWVGEEHDFAHCYVRIWEGWERHLQWWQCLMQGSKPQSEEGYIQLERQLGVWRSEIE